MTDKQQLNLPGVPEGWRAVAYRPPDKGEWYLGCDDAPVKCCDKFITCSFLIVERIPEPWHLPAGITLAPGTWAAYCPIVKDWFFASGKPPVETNDFHDEGHERFYFTDIERLTGIPIPRPEFDGNWRESAFEVVPSGNTTTGGNR